MINNNMKLTFITIFICILFLTQSMHIDDPLNYFSQNSVINIGIEGFWTGDECDKECVNIRGIVCDAGQNQKKCCVRGCAKKVTC